jgi:syntaxin 18
MDLTPLFATVLSSTSSKTLSAHPFDVDTLDAFLQQGKWSLLQATLTGAPLQRLLTSTAYSINRSMNDIARYLHRIRKPYLALNQHTSSYGRRGNANGNANGSAKGHDDAITDADRDRVQEETNASLKGIYTAIKALSKEAEEATRFKQLVAEKARSKRTFGAIGRWAQGGGAIPKTAEEQLQDDREAALGEHRENVLLYLNRRLQRLNRYQQDLVQKRLERTMGREKSALYKAGGDFDKLQASNPLFNGDLTNGADSYKAVELDMEERDEQRAALEAQISPAFKDMLLQERDEMLNLYDAELEEIRFVIRQTRFRIGILTIPRKVQNSLMSIAELQTSLEANIEQQAERITEMKDDSVMTSENVVCCDHVSRH